MKPFWKSKTIWFNACMGIFTFVSMNMEQFKAGMTPEGFQILATVITLGNVILRAFTEQPVGTKHE